MQQKKLLYLLIKFIIILNSFTYFLGMDKQSKLAKATVTENKTSLGKRKKSELSEGNSNVLDSVIKDQRKKIQKVTHSNAVDGELVEKMKSEIIPEPSFVQTKIACACGWYHTITLSNDGTLHSFGQNNDGQLGLGHNNNVSLPTPIPNLPKIKLISCGCNFTVCVDYEGFIWSFVIIIMANSEQGTKQHSMFLKNFKRFLLFFLFLVDQITH